MCMCIYLCASVSIQVRSHIPLLQSSGRAPKKIEKETRMVLVWCFRVEPQDCSCSGSSSCPQKARMHRARVGKGDCMNRPKSSK